MTGNSIEDLFDPSKATYVWRMAKVEHVDHRLVVTAFARGGFHQGDQLVAFVSEMDLDEPVPLEDLSLDEVHYRARTEMVGVAALDQVMVWLADQKDRLARSGWFDASIDMTPMDVDIPP